MLHFSFIEILLGDPISSSKPLLEDSPITDIPTDKNLAASDFSEVADDPSKVFGNIPPVLTGETMITSSNNQTIQGKHRGLSLSMG